MSKADSLDARLEALRASRRRLFEAQRHVDEWLVVPE